MRGIELAHRFYAEVVAPRLEDDVHAAALLGDGSEVLGFDDATSTDHCFGPRLQVFVDDAVTARRIDQELTRTLPGRFAGFPVAFAVPGRFAGAEHHQVEVTTASAFFSGVLGVDPIDGMRLHDWLLAPTQRLATLSAGAVFHDPTGALAARREELRWYPPDVWRYVLAAAWLRVSQEHAFVGRTGALEDELGSRVIAARLVRELVRLAFLVERVWAPYSKWLGRAFGQLPIAAALGPHLRAALVTDAWRDREAALVRAAERLAVATNSLELAEPVDPTPRRFHDRDIRIVDAEAFTAALSEAIQDVEVVQLMARLGRRPATTLGRLPGAIDQAIDSTDVLTSVERCRSAGDVLGLGC